MCSQASCKPNLRADNKGPHRCAGIATTTSAAAAAGGGPFLSVVCALVTHGEGAHLALLVPHAGDHPGRLRRREEGVDGEGAQQAEPPLVSNHLVAVKVVVDFLRRACGGLPLVRLPTDVDPHDLKLAVRQRGVLLARGPLHPAKCDLEGARLGHALGPRLVVRRRHLAPVQLQAAPAGETLVVAQPDELKADLRQRNARRCVSGGASGGWRVPARYYEHGKREPALRAGGQLQVQGRLGEARRGEARRGGARMEGKGKEGNRIEQNTREQKRTEENRTEQKRTE